MKYNNSQMICGDSLVIRIQEDCYGYSNKKLHNHVWISHGTWYILNLIHLVVEEEVRYHENHASKSRTFVMGKVVSLIFPSPSYPPSSQKWNHASCRHEEPALKTMQYQTMWRWRSEHLVLGSLLVDIGLGLVYQMLVYACVLRLRWTYVRVGRTCHRQHPFQRRDEYQHQRDCPWRHLGDVSRRKVRLRKVSIILLLASFDASEPAPWTVSLT